MSKKTILSIFLIIVGVSASLLVIFAYAGSGGKASITMGFLTAALTCIIVGSILGVFTPARPDSQTLCR